VKKIAQGKENYPVDLRVNLGRVGLKFYGGKLVLITWLPLLMASWPF
jgi:hypothetical protein